MDGRQRVHRGELLLMRYAPIIGYSGGRRAVTVAARCWSVAHAVQRAQNMGGGPYWIARVGKAAHRSQPKSS